MHRPSPHATILDAAFTLMAWCIELLPVKYYASNTFFGAPGGSSVHSSANPNKVSSLSEQLQLGCYDYSSMSLPPVGEPFSLVGFRVLFGRCCGCCGANSSRIDKHQRSSIIRADLATTKQCAPSKAEILRYFAYSAHLRLELAHRSVAYPPAGPHSHADRFGWETRAETPLTPHNLPPDICKHRGF